tara:strand:- start:142 stop:705 length:564 start_codon:yes stop_codon:yes gene_type:complete
MKLNIFKDSIIIEEYENNKIHSRIKNILKNEKKNNKGRVVSNINGFQTNNIKDQIVEEFILNCFSHCIKNNYTAKKAFDAKLDNFWINENLPNSYNQEHVHPYTDFSGVYYLEVPKNSGNIYFKKYDMIKTNLSYLFNDSDFYTEFFIENKKNQFFLFSSDFIHGVYLNKSKKPRISISFNISIIKK